jgi:CHAT domain-containing protein/Tfp pilus assembly protein PilF
MADVKRFVINTGLAVMLLASVTFAAEEVAQEASNEHLLSAIALYRAEGPDTALPEFQRLLEQFRSSGDRPSEAVTLRYIGESYWRTGDFNHSRQYLDRAMALATELDARFDQGKTLNVLGLLEWDLGNFDAALSTLRRANALAGELDHKQLLASTLNNLGLVQDELGDYQASLAGYRQAFELFQAENDLRGQGDAIGNLGGVHLLLGQFAQALAYYQQALTISEQIGSRTAMTIDHGNLALSFQGLGRYDDALRHFDRALMLARETGMDQEEAYWLRGKANTLVALGDYTGGLENHREALDIYRTSGARALLLDALHDMGRLHLELGDPLSAEAYFREAIKMAGDIGHQQAITVNQLALGDLQFERTLYTEAKEFYTQVVERSEQAQERFYLASGLLRLADISRQEQAYATAAQQAGRALAITDEIGASALQAEAWLALGHVRRLASEADTALEAYRHASVLAAELNNPELRWQAHYGTARAHLQGGNRAAAISELESAVHIIESVRNRLKEDRFRSGYLQDKHQVYVDLVRLQIETGNVEGGFSTAERLRSQSFLAQLDRRVTQGLSEQDRQSEAAMRERIRQLQTSLSDEQSRPRQDRRQMAVAAYTDELLRAERDYQAFLDDRLARTAQHRSSGRAASADIQQMLNQGQALVEFVLDRQQVMIFVLTAEGLTATFSPLERDVLERKIHLLRALIQQPGSDRWIKPAHSLYLTLLAPLQQRGLLGDAQQLYLVPHGVLNYLPFALLPDAESGSQLVLDRFAISYLPAASSLAGTEVIGAGGGGVLALAPERARLRHAPQEARSVTQLFNPEARLLEGKAATEGAFKTDALNFGVLHLATHGVFNRNNPLLSGLTLEPDEANDGLLQIHEILGMSLDAQLVTLSACQTGLGSGYFSEIPAGDEFVSLTRAFLQAGSQAVLASLWEVDDRSTVDLMEHFYQQLTIPGGPQGKAAALALAQKAIRGSTEFNHPYYWAPFVLVGPHDQPLARS